jgi:hypothetical protein
MVNMSQNFINSRWIPLIYQSEEIKEDPPNLCIWNAAILVMICVCPDDTSREADKITDKSSVSQ